MVGQTSSAAVIALSASEIATLFGPAGVERARRLLPAARWVDPDALTSAQWNQLLQAERPRVVISAWRTPRLPSTVPGLAYVCHCTGSVRGVLPRELMEQGVRVTNWGDVASPLVAEHALLLTLAALRSVAAWPAFMSEPFDHEDKNRLQTRSLRGRPVAVHGFGRIARELVKLLRPFGGALRGYSSGVPDDLMRSHGVTPAVDLVDLARGADVFISCEALTERSRRSIDEAVLSALPDGAVFVNVGRGAVVDEAALVRVARRKNLRVASDVFETEPLPPDSPLNGLPNAIYSPHVAGPTLDCYPQCGAIALDNLEHYLAGRPLVSELSLEQYDRST